MTLTQLENVALREFRDLVLSSNIEQNKLRLFLADGSYLDIFNSFSIPDRWAFQWERRHLDSSMYRHDNMPHVKWKVISSFPWHFHDGNEDSVESSDFGANPINNLRLFFKFIKDRLI